MLVASPYAVFKADRPLIPQPVPSPAVAATPQRRVSKTLTPTKRRAAWATLIQGNLFDPLQPL